MDIKISSKITATIPTDGNLPYVQANGVIVVLDTIIVNENGVIFRNDYTGLQLEVTDTIELVSTKMDTCIMVVAPDAVAHIHQNFIHNCTL